MSRSHWKRDVALFLATQFLSLFGSSLVQYAIMWHMVLETRSGAVFTAYVLSSFLPTFLLSPFAGVWADRWNRKHLLVLADSGIAVATLLAALIYRAGYDGIWLLFVVAAVRAMGTGIQVPAVGALLPDLAPAASLPRVNGMLSTLQSAVSLLSPVLGAALMATADLVTVFWIDVATAAVAVMMLYGFLHVEAHEKARGPQQTGYCEDLRAGLAYIGNHDYLRPFFLFSAAFMFAAAPVAFLTPLQVARRFGGDVWHLSAIEVAFSAGMMAGGVLMTLWGGLRNKVHTMALSNFVVGAGSVGLGVISTFGVYLAIMALLGIALPVFHTPSNVLLQQKVETNYLGRVYGVYGMLSNSIMPLGMLLFGPLADFVSIECLLVVTGALMVCQSAAMASNKALTRAGSADAA